MSNKVIGRVAIKVVPDTKTFKPDLKRHLEAVEQDPSVGVRVQARVSAADLLDSTREAIRKVNATLRTLAKSDPSASVKVPIDVDDMQLFSDRLRAFNREIQDSIDNAQKSAFVDLPVRVIDKHLFTEAKRAIRKVNTELRASKTVVRVPVELEEMDWTEVRVEVDADSARREMARLRTEQERKGLSLRIDLSGTRRAAARLGALARARIVPIIPVVSRTALTAASKQLERLTAVSSFRKLTTQLDNLLKPGRMLGLGTMNLLLLNLTSGLTGAVAGLLGTAGALGVAIKESTYAGLVLPGIFAGVMAITKQLSWAIQDAAVKIPDLIEQWKALRVAVSDEFWSRAINPLREMVDSLFPEFERGQIMLAESVGNMFGRLFDEMTANLNDGSITRFFSSVSEGAREASEGLDGLIRGLRELILHGASYLPRLGRNLAELADSFGDSMERMASDGSLVRLTEQGLFAIRELGRLAEGTGGTLAALARAGMTATGITITTLADRMELIAETLSSPAAQAGMVGFFRATLDGLKAFVDTAGQDVSDAILGFVKHADMLLPRAGEGFGHLIGGIADMLNQPAFQAGLYAFVDGFAKGFEILRPTLRALAGPLGYVMQTLGEAGSDLLPQLGRTLLAVAGPFAAIFDSLVEVMTTIAPTITEGLGGLALGLAALISDPAVAAGVMFIVDGLSQGLAALVPLLPTLAPLFLQLAYSVGTLLGELGPVLAELVPSLITGLQSVAVMMTGLLLTAIPFLPLISGLLENLPMLIAGLAGLKLAGLLAGAGLIAAGGPLFWILAGITAAMVAFPSFRDGVLEFLEPIGAIADALWEKLKQFADWLANGPIGDFVRTGLNVGLALAGGEDALYYREGWEAYRTGNQPVDYSGASVQDNRTYNIHNPAPEPTSTSVIRASDRTANER